MADDINLYVKEKLEEYIREEDQDQYLWELFRQDFEGLRRDNFEAITLQNKQRLLKHLHYSGVYVLPAGGGGVLYDDALIELLNDDTFHTWGNRELDELIQSPNFQLDKILSEVLKDRVQKRLTKYQAYNRANRSTIKNLDIPTQFTYTTLHSTSKIPKILQKPAIQSIYKKSSVQLPPNTIVQPTYRKSSVQLPPNIIVRPTYKKSFVRLAPSTIVQPTYDYKLPTTPLPDVAKSKIPKTLKSELLTVAEKFPVQPVPIANVQPTYESEIPTVAEKFPVQPVPIANVQPTYESEILTVAEKSIVQPTPITSSPIQPTYEKPTYKSEIPKTLQKSPVQLTYNCELPTVAEKPPVQLALGAIVQPTYDCELLTVAEKPPVQTTYEKSPVQLALGAIVQPTYEKCPVQPTYKSELPTIPLSNVSKSKPELTVQPTTITIVQPTPSTIVQLTYKKELLTVTKKPAVQPTTITIVQPIPSTIVQLTYKKELLTVTKKPAIQPTTITTVQPTYENSKALLAVKLLTTLVSKLYKVQYTLEVGQGILACEYVTYALPEDYG